MSRPLFRARNLDPSKPIRLLIDQQPQNHQTQRQNDNSKQFSRSSTQNQIQSSHSSTSICQTSQSVPGSISQMPQRSVSKIPFVSGMEREEEAV